MEPIVEIVKDSQASSTNFYLNDFYDSGFTSEARPDKIHLSFMATNRVTGDNSTFFISKDGIISKNKARITAEYSRNSFKIVDLSDDHMMKYITMSEVSQDGFAIEGIGEFDSYVEGNLLFQVEHNGNRFYLYKRKRW
jgi:hypothetical protein